MGVQGDFRTYRHPLALFLTHPPKSWESIEEISTEITNAEKEINRVILCLSHSAPPDEISVLPNALTHDRVEILQEIDEIVMSVIRSRGILRDIWQFPVVLIPVSSDNKRESVVLRPVFSEEAMTADFAKIDWEIMEEIRDKVMQTGLISMLFFDLTFH